MFEDREDAGRKLTLKLRRIITDNNFVVIALLRGGIVLGKIISDFFKIPLIPLAVKKIGAPLNPELAIGAVTFDKTSFLDSDLIKNLGVDEEYLANALENKYQEAKNLQEKFTIKTSLENRKIIIVDDGVATGTTAICASFFAKKTKAEKIILATPVIAKDTLKNIKRYFDKVISLEKVDNLSSVSQFYEYFPQVTDEETIEILNSK